MLLYDNALYINDIAYVANLSLPWDKFHNANVLLSGATGMLGSFLVDVLMFKNSSGLNCNIYAIGRNQDKFYSRFSPYNNSPWLHFINHDVLFPMEVHISEAPTYVLHLASNTHPVQYATDPIGTITTNVLGLLHMLELACAINAIRFAFASSNEIYGETRHDVKLFKESYCGYIDPNTLRAGYPESKRCGEALCQAYRIQKHLDIVIPRFTRSYGPTMQFTDTKVVSQFIKNGLTKDNIILKSAGTQYYSFTYAADAVSGLLYILLKGNSGEAYNIADERNDIILKDLAQYIAGLANTSVVYDIPDKTEQQGYSTATIARLDGSKLKELGWEPKYTIFSGIKQTLDILQHLNEI